MAIYTTKLSGGQNYLLWNDLIYFKKDNFSLGDLLRDKCCNNDCSMNDLKTLCCFTNKCLAKCYPGKGHKMGPVY